MKLTIPFQHVQKWNSISSVLRHFKRKPWLYYPRLWHLTRLRNRRLKSICHIPPPTFLEKPQELSTFVAQTLYWPQDWRTCTCKIGIKIRRTLFTQFHIWAIFKTSTKRISPFLVGNTSILNEIEKIELSVIIQKPRLPDLSRHLVYWHQGEITGLRPVAPMIKGINVWWRGFQLVV